MSSDRDRLQSLVDALPDSEIQVAISFLAELGEQEIIDDETAAKLDLARTEAGDDVPLEEIDAGSGCDAARGFPPCGGARSGTSRSRCSGTNRCGVGALRSTGHGDVKSLKDRPGELRLRVGKWRIFFSLESPDIIRVLGIDNRGEAY